MILLETPFRQAKKTDAALLAELVNEAGDGMPLYLWSKLTEAGESASDVGARRAARDEGSFTYRNAILIEDEGRAAGCLIGYAIDKEPAPIAADMPAMFVPLQQLENLAPATWYVNVLAVLPDLRGRGLGTRLLDLAETIGRSHDLAGMSVIVADANPGARRLYERCGYRETATRAMVKEGWQGSGSNWELLVKPF